MAIFRGGVKIFGSDVRLGIPRDRSLDNILRDPRFKRVEGGERPENFDLRSTKPALINQMLQYIMQGEGLGRSGRFYASFRLPKGSEGPLSGIYAGAEEKRGFSTEEINTQIQGQDGRRVNAFCKGITIPDRIMTTVPVITGPGAPRHFVTDHTYGDLSATFFADKYLRERQIIELWMKMAHNNLTNEAKYYDDYTGKMQIYQLGSLDGEGDRDVPTYGIEAIEVFPQTLSAVEYSYGSSNQLVKINVGFAYKQWYNLTTDHISGMTFGNSMQTIHDQKSPDTGLFGRLPIELQRAGREVFNSAKRQVPIGRLFKGKLFPPFT